MAVEHIERTIADRLRRAAAAFPAILLTGPRQSGKTTLLRRCFGSSHEYVAVDSPTTAVHANADPEGFVDEHPPPVIFDEAQAAPAVWSVLRARIDDVPDMRGGYLLSGSQNLALSGRVKESLAGRVAVLELSPLTIRERLGDPHRPLPWERDGSQSPPAAPTVVGRERGVWDLIYRGGFPHAHALDLELIGEWQESMLAAYLERDVRTIGGVGDLLAFRQFMRLVALGTGQELSYSSIARDLGISVETARRWLSVLAASYQVTILTPFVRSERKRVRRRPRVYVADTGILCALTGVAGVDIARDGPLAGKLFETAVVNEIVATLKARPRVLPPLSYWRTAHGVEVDLVVEYLDRLVAVEAKASATLRPRMVSGLRSLSGAIDERAFQGYLVHTGGPDAHAVEGITAIRLLDL